MVFPKSVSSLFQPTKTYSGLRLSGYWIQYNDTIKGPRKSKEDPLKA